jgi:hypothetical protein
MRKVNLRNVDPAIDDPDASTWCMYYLLPSPFSSNYRSRVLHLPDTIYLWFRSSSLAHPTLNRHSPPEMVANFKRRVPPRPPKGKRRTDDVGTGGGSSLSTSPSKASVGVGGMVGSSKLPSLSSSVDNSMQYGSLQPVIAPPPSSSNDPLLSGGGSGVGLGLGVGGGGLGGVGGTQGAITGKWNHPYGRNALPPLSIPGVQGDFGPLSSSSSAQQQQQQQQQQQPPPQQQQSQAYPGATPNSSSGSSRYGNVHPITPTDDVTYANPSVYQPRDHHSHLFSFPSSASSSSGIIGGGGAAGGPADASSPIGFTSVHASTATPFTTTNTGWTTPTPFDQSSAQSSHHHHNPFHSSSSSGGTGAGIPTPQLPPLNTSISGGGSLSALLNHNPGSQSQHPHSGAGRSPPQHHITSGYPSPYGAVPPHGGLSRPGGPGGAGGGAGGSSPTATSASVSRPTTGYSSVSSGGNGFHGVAQSPLDYHHPAYNPAAAAAVAAAMGGTSARRPSSSGGPGSSSAGAIRRVPTTREHGFGLGSMPYPAPSLRHPNIASATANSSNTGGGLDDESGGGFGSQQNNGGRPLTAPAAQAARRLSSAYTPMAPQRTSTSYGGGGPHHQQHQHPDLSLLTSGYPTHSTGGTPTPTSTTAPHHYSWGHPSSGAGGAGTGTSAPMSPTATFAYTVSGSNPTGSTSGGGGSGGGGEFAYSVPPPTSSHGQQQHHYQSQHRDSPSYSQSRPGTAASLGGGSSESTAPGGGGHGDDNGAAVAAAAAMYGMGMAGGHNTGSEPPQLGHCKSRRLSTPLLADLYLIWKFLTVLSQDRPTSSSSTSQ